MGAGLWPVFNPPRDATPDFDGGLLLNYLEELDELASAIGARAVSSFGDNREVPDGFDGDPDELDELLGPWQDWFSIADGERCFNQLATALTAPAHAARFEHAEHLREELLDLVRCLERAPGDGERFRLEFVS